MLRHIDSCFGILRQSLYLPLLIYYRYRDPDPLLLHFEWPCKHNSSKLQCNRISKRQILKNRKRFFQHHTKVQQDIFLTRLISPYAPERRRDSKVSRDKQKKRQFSTTYFLKDVKKPRPVYQKLFLKVFSLKKDRVNTIAKTIFEGSIPREKRGGDRKSAKSLEKIEALKKFIGKFPATESHYNRSKSKRIYLSCELSQSKLRRMYNYSVPPNLQIKKTMFQKVFTQCFNIGFKSPASDACGTCILLNNQIKTETNPEKKRILMVQKRVHTLRGKAFYNLCKKHVNDSASVCFCFDLQQVQPLPKTPIQDAFYSRQISYYNLCMVGMDSKCPKFYQWTEIQGGRGSTEVGSALMHYLDSLDLEGKKILRLFCDGCGGQNKNSHIIHALLFWLVNKSPEHIEEINITYPVRGHSFLPADRVFGRVEKEIKTVPVITKKEEYVEIYKNHGTVLILGQHWERLDIKSLEKYYKKHEGLRDLKRINLKKYEVKQGRARTPKTVYQLKTYKNFINESEEERKPFCILKRGKCHPSTIQTVTEKLQLSAKKKQDVRNLLLKQFGGDWETCTELLWYKKVLNDENIDEDEENDDHEIHDCQDEQCDCLEFEISNIV